ncbi:hypothetical protein GCM10009759_12580 [Kitasatospora saccharophila]|uniref:CMP/dCMP-type deaminase domain-containing protein n=1 Tax=Kitasatospora saccharophila TaxID=407973 RepID=A0ABN2WCZ9_9ACTN
MYQAPAPKPSDTADAVLTGLTAAETAYLREPPEQTPDDARALAELQALAGVLSRSLTQLEYERPLTELPAATLAHHAKAVRRKVLELTTGSGQLPGREARKKLFSWSQGEGQEAFAAVAALRKVLVARLKENDAARLAAQQPAQRPAPAPPVQRGNGEILAAELAKALRENAPQGTETVVRAILVAGGEVYRGRNDGSALLDLTYAVVSHRTDRLETWTVGNCAEVHALDWFIHAQGFSTEAEVVAAFLNPPVAFPDSWIVAMDARGRDVRSWVKRTPCENCQQWLKALGIKADTKGAAS